MRSITPGRLLFEQIVPPEFMDGVDDGPIDSGKMKTILQSVAEKSPEKYRDISHQILKMGAKTSNEVPASFSLDDLKSPIDKGKIFQQVAVKEAAIRARKDLTPQQRNNELVKVYSQYSSSMPELVFQAAQAKDSNLARMVAAGARGSKGQLNSNIGADWLMLDANSNPIPIPIKNSYADGLSPAEYFAAAYGTRRGLLSTKFCCKIGEKVLMADFSEREIQDIKVGEWVMGSDASGKTLPVQVLNIFDNGKMPCWKFTFRYLSSRSEVVEFCGTGDHRLLARRRDWGADKARAIDTPTKMACGKMSKTRHVLVPAECDSFGGKKEHRALLLGILLGNGCTTASAGTNLKLSCADDTFLADTRDYFASLNFYASKGCSSESDYTFNLNYLVAPPKDIRSDGERDRGYCGCPTKKWLNEVGAIGKYSHEKEIPAETWTWDNDSVAQLLSGLFSTDSSIDRTTAASGGCGIAIRLTLTAKSMVMEAKRLLRLRFGIYSSALYFIAKEKKKNATHDQWSIVICHRRSIERFARFIHLIGSKGPELQTLRDEIPQSRNNEQHTFKFLSKELLGEHPTFDIEVDHPDHLFVMANGIISSNSVQQSGYLSKQLSAASHDLIVSEKDCETNRGFPSTPDDKDNIGGVMAVGAGGFPSGTIITSRVLKQLRDNKVSKLTVRSPLTCTAKNGICAVCAGIGARNKFPQIGERVGLAAASSIGEPLSQSTLSEKHSGGVASSSGKAVSAFKSIDSLVQIPDTFPNGASVSGVDGRVTKIEEAPQGGNFVYVDNKQHYVGHDQEVSVKRGDSVEAGDTLSSGVPNPYDIVKHKGVGQGRVYFTNALRNALNSNNISSDRRQIEVLGRALVNHVKVTDPEGYGSHMPDDIVEYSAIEQDFEPENSTKGIPSQSIGKFLARPVMHYSLGTRITPSVAKDLDDNDEKEIDTTDTSPGFEPDMQRVMDIPGHKPDWMAQLSGSNLKKRMLQNVHSGDAVSDPYGPSYIPSLARGVGFGDPPPKTRI